MAAGLPDRVDCARLADEHAILQREFALEDLPRLRDLLAHPSGLVSARYEFARVAGSRAGATVSVWAVLDLLCQRCLQGFAFPLTVSSEIEFANDVFDIPEDSPLEIYSMNNGLASLCELAEEELLLALPVIAVCNSPHDCGRAPALDVDIAQATRRPFAGLQDLLKKT